MRLAYHTILTFLVCRFDSPALLSMNQTYCLLARRQVTFLKQAVSRHILAQVFGRLQSLSHTLRPGLQHLPCCPVTLGEAQAICHLSHVNIAVHVTVTLPEFHDFSICLTARLGHPGPV